jgi:hypothetical protein
MAEPTIKLESGSPASVLSYNAPEPTSYSGRHPHRTGSAEASMK